MLMLGSALVVVLAVAFAIVCAFMMLVILIQKPKGGGLSGAFGGAGGSAEAAFGSKTGDVLTVVTVSCFVLFLLLAMGLTWAVRPEGRAARAELERMTQVQTEEVADEPAGAAMPKGGAEEVLGNPPDVEDQPAAQGEPVSPLPSAVEPAPLPESAAQPALPPTTEEAEATPQP